MSCNLDIRRIELYKQFRELDVNLTAKHEWQVFGYYDSMNVEKLKIEEKMHPLEYVYEDSQHVSFDSSSSLKKHVIYAIGLDDPNKYLTFWEQRNEHPLLLVSLIHFKHPMESEKGDASSVSQLEQIMESLKNSFTTKINDCYVIYSAFDCNDAIVFMFADALNTAMQNISEITKENDAIREIFTIYARKNTILSTTEEKEKEQEGIEPKEKPEEIKHKLEELMEIWQGNQSVLEKVDVFMRDASHKKLIADTEELETQYLIAYNSESFSGCFPNGSKAEYPFRRYIMPGHEDVLLTLEKVPLPLFEKMFSPPVNEKDILDGFFLKRISRTVISTEPPSAHGDDKPENKTEASSTRASTLVKKLKNAFDSKDGTNNDKLKEALSLVFSEGNDRRTPIWLGALMELLVELSNIEVSLTAYDIYAQAIFAQKVMIDTLCELVERAKEYANDKSKDNKVAKYLIKEIYDPSSKLSSNFTEYLNGWSQLSFHAMHAEWQLTQSSDINRLYMFPAKLCRLYDEFMKLTSRFLNTDNCERHEESVFFITPNIRDIPRFLSIYQPITEPNNLSYKLILGEIPADNMFSPQVILPHLVHEAAHYSGYVFRKRRKRNTVYLKCLLAHLIHQLIKADLLMQPVAEGGPELLDSLIEKIVKNHFTQKINICGESDQNEYGDIVEKTVEREIDKLLSQQPLFITSVIEEEIKKIPTYAEKPRLEQILSIAEYYKGPEMEHDVISYYDRTNIGKVSSDLMNLLRESFSDLCMVKMLDLKLVDYLSVICHGIRYAPNRTNEDVTNENEDVTNENEDVANNDEEAWSRHERFYAVIQTAFNQKKKAIELLESKEIEKQLKENRYISQAHYQAVKDKAKAFHKYEKSLLDERPNHRVYMRKQIRDYLEEVSQELDKHMKDDHIIADLRRVYKLMSVNLRVQDDSNPFTFKELAEVGKIMHLKRNSSDETHADGEATSAECQ